MKKNIKRSTFVIIIPVLVLLIIMGICATLFSMFFCNIYSDIVTEVETIPSYVVNGKLYADDKTCDIARICESNGKNSTLCEVYCVSDTSVFFAYSEPIDIKGRNWVIAKVDIETLDIEIVCQLSNAKEIYSRNYTSEYSERNGYYFDRQIILNDYSTVLVYDIDTETTNTYSVDKFDFPKRSIYGNFLDGQKIELVSNGTAQIFTLEEMAQNSNGISELYEAIDKKTWCNMSYVSNLFNSRSIQYIDNKIYAVGAGLNYWGTSSMIIFEYDSNARSWKYVTSELSGNTVNGNCYVISSVS